MRGGRTKWAAAALLLAVALAVVGAGCGSNSSNNGAPAANASFTDYEKQMQALSQSLYNALRAQGVANRNASTAKIVLNLRKSQTELRAAAVTLEKIKPPDRVKAQHEMLLKGVRLYADELDTIIGNVRRGGGVNALGAITALKGVRDMGKATTAITQAGYVICLSGRNC